MDNKGQAVMSEYVMIFFVVIAAAVAMTVFVQRTLEARIHDERNFMIDSVVNSGACDANCLQAAGGNIYHEYEPYYVQAVSDVAQNQTDTTGARQGNAQILGAIYTKSINEGTNSSSTSCQLPPACTNYNLNNGPVPCYCTCPCTCPDGSCPVAAVPRTGELGG